MTYGPSSAPDPGIVYKTMQDVKTNVLTRTQPFPVSSRPALEQILDRYESRNGNSYKA